MGKLSRSTEHFSSHHFYPDADNIFCSIIFSGGEFQLTQPWSAKVFSKVVEEAQNYSTLVP